MATIESTAGELGTIETNIPARLDRLPWSRWHWRILIGLGTVWILDGLEVTIVGSIAGAISAKGSGINISAADVAGWAASMYVAGACVGALLFGQLTDRFGRKRLFMITLGVYLAATIADGVRVDAAVLLRLPLRDRHGHRRRVRGDQLRDRRADPGPAIAGGSTSSSTAPTGRARQRARCCQWSPLHIFSPLLNWRVCFGLGAILGTAILIVRRSVPESPRWLFIHGREDEAEKITRDIERQVRRAPASSSTIPTRRSRSSSASRSACGRSRARSSRRTRSGPCSALRCSSARRSSTTRSCSATRRC